MKTSGLIAAYYALWTECRPLYVKGGDIVLKIHIILDSSVDVVTRLRAGWPWSDGLISSSRKTYFLFFMASTLAFQLTQPPLPWVPEVTRPGREADHLPPCSTVLPDHSGRAVWSMNYLRSNAGIVGSNPTQGMDICDHSACVGIGLAMGWSPI
jgi:hypothetical protein